MTPFDRSFKSINVNLLMFSQKWCKLVLLVLWTVFEMNDIQMYNITIWLVFLILTPLGKSLWFWTIRHNITLWLIYFSGPEPQILDYQTQQYKLFPVLADTYALFFMSRNLRRQYNRMMEDIRNKGSYKMLAEVYTCFHLNSRLQ